MSELTVPKLSVVRLSPGSRCSVMPSDSPLLDNYRHKQIYLEVDGYAGVQQLLGELVLEIPTIEPQQVPFWGIDRSTATLILLGRFYGRADAAKYLQLYTANRHKMRDFVKNAVLTVRDIRYLRMAHTLHTRHKASGPSPEALV